MTTDTPNEALSFDFHSYLLELTGHKWTIHDLPGGNANHTVRALRAPENAVEIPEQKAIADRGGLLGYFDGFTSLVLKQAPPYFAKIPDLPFSQDRQIIEEKALSLLHTPSFSGAASLLLVLHSNLLIRVPHLIYYDLTKHVLIQSDLGNIPELYKFLTSPDTTPALASSAGAILGRFLKDLHGALYYASEVTKEELRHRFANDEGEVVLCGIIANTLRYMKDAGVEDRVLLEKRAQDNWTSRERTVFGQGDIWFGTVLVGVKDGVIKVGICDWEFAGFNHPAGDIAQLGSYLHLASMSPLTTPYSQTIFQSFSSAFYSSYSPPPSSSRAEFQRSLVIMHAWEMINAAAWRHHLWCTCPGKSVKCDHIADMIQAGAQLLRAAGDTDNDGTIRDIDWEALRDVEWCRFLKLN